MTTLTDTLKQMLNALACADAAEFLTPAQKTECLDRARGRKIAPPVHAEDLAPEAAPATVGGRRHVAMYMGSELPADMMGYVVQTCARLKHGLTVLTFQPEDEGRALLKPYLSMLAEAGVGMQLVALTGDPVPGLARYLRAHPEVAFLACRETGYLGRSFLNGTQRKNALPVPVVLVESQQDAMLQPTRESESEMIGKTSVG